MRGSDCKFCTPVHSEEPVTDREECHSCRHVLSASNISSLERKESLRRELGTGVDSYFKPSKRRTGNRALDWAVQLASPGRYGGIEQTSHTLVNILQVNPRVEGVRKRTTWIILGAEIGRHGLPSEIVDDPLLDLVLPQREAHMSMPKSIAYSMWHSPAHANRSQ